MEQSILVELNRLLPDASACAERAAHHRVEMPGLQRESCTACLAAPMGLVPKQHVAPKGGSSQSASDLPLGTGEHAVQRSALDAALRRVDCHRARLRGSERVSKLLQRCALGGGSGGGCGGGGAGGDGVGCGAGGGGAGGGAGDRARRCAVAGTRGEAGIANSRFHRNDTSRVSTESGMGRRPKTFGIGFGFATCPHQKLEKVTDVTVV